MIRKSMPICGGCWRKLEGPVRQPTRVKQLAPGERWQPCYLCRGPTDSDPGIYRPMWVQRPPTRPEPPEAA